MSGLKSLARGGHAMGLDVVKSSNKPSSIELHLNNVFQKDSIDCVIGVGVNAGQYGSSLRKMGLNVNVSERESELL